MELSEATLHIDNLYQQERTVDEGILLIADISGFTELVHATDVSTGSRITYALLSAIIDTNTLGLGIAEIEGDAVFFYRYGPPPATKDILLQYECMLKAFHQKLREVQVRYQQQFSLSLKGIAHYGKMTTYRIGGFNKLYGEAVVEAHRLLKNNVPSFSYVLITDELIDECTLSKEEQLRQKGIRSHKLCNVYGGLRKICFTYFDYSSQMLQHNQVP